MEYDERVYQPDPSMSFHAGESFGRMVYMNNPGMTFEQFQQVLADIHPKAPLLISWYRRGAQSGFSDTRVRRLLNINGTSRHPGHYGLDGKFYPGKSLPGEFRESPEGALVMPLVKAPQFNQDDREVVWANAAQFYQFDVIFNIKGITNSTEKWYLEIVVRQDTLPESNADLDIDLGLEDINYEEQKVLMSFSRGGRDEDMKAAKELIKSSGTMYNCYIDRVKLDSGRIFYDVNRLPKESALYQEPPRVKTRPSGIAGKETVERRIPGMGPKSFHQSVESASQDFDPFLDSEDLP